VFRAAYGQHADPRRVWAFPIDEFERDFTFVPNPRHPEANATT